MQFKVTLTRVVYIEAPSEMVLDNSLKQFDRDGKRNSDHVISNSVGLVDFKIEHDPMPELHESEYTIEKTYELVKRQQ